MPHAVTWYCHACGLALGTVKGPTLQVVPATTERPAPAVLVTPRGVIVTCPSCRADRTWSLRASA